MISKKLSVFSLFLSIIFSLNQECSSQKPYDYAYMPDQPFDYQHMDLTLTLEPEQHLARGVVTYQVSSKQDGITSLALDIEESAVDAVSVNGKTTDYEIREGKLVVQLPDTTQRGKPFDITVTWQSNSEFGLYKDSFGNFWSSKNPLAHRHWLPGFDHPRNELSFTASFIIPVETEVMFNGDLEGSVPQSETTKKVTFSSETEVPFTGLGFAFGDFEITEVTSGFTKVRLFSTEDFLSDEASSTLVKQASEIKKSVEEKLSREYPWESLNIVMLPDNFWEERTNGTGIIYLYENLGDFSPQLKRGIYSQWFGEFHRVEQFVDLSGYMDFAQTALHFELEEAPIIIENPDSMFLIDQWNAWQQAYPGENELVQQTVSSSLPILIREDQGVNQVYNYIEYWYQETGIPFNSLDVPSIKEEGSKERRDYPVYHLDTYYDEANSEIEMVFTLVEGDGSELYEATLNVFTFDKSASHKLLFTGESDTLRKKISPTTEFVNIQTVTLPAENVEFGDFPLYFILNELRNEDPENRKQAAILLQKNADNPDLQLALNDVLANEEVPEVKAELLLALAQITNGAIGTEELFINELSNSSEDIEVAALTALRKFPENEWVSSSVRSKILNTESELVFKTALSTYKELADTEALTSLVDRIRRNDTTGIKTLGILSEVITPENSEEFIPIGEAYLDYDFPHTTREEALTFLLKNDYSEERWKTRLNDLSEDNDPRIRFVSLNGATKLSKSAALLYLNTIIGNEFDIRIYSKAEELKELISE
ncbi:MAG TPA: hypothetical protein DEQ34_09915 [Balneolaceae bacterium]|nr:hypothetical protein [Balneolaceae bacterium]|tara:strand:+ start:24784 stop:27093 length:2310 start_codon:yes stop_codon:yes gene_type:complete